MVKSSNQTLFHLAGIIAIFLILICIGIFLQKKLKNSSNKYLNPSEFLPDDEIHTLRQVFYLILMALCFINFLYSLISIEMGDLSYFALFDIALSLYIAISLDKTYLKNKILMILLIPYGSLVFLIDPFNLIGLIDFIHIPVFLYLVKVYFDKFMEYTESNGLGVTVILLFSIIFVSFFITQVVENKNPLDALVMVSNAFTSNGYAVLGNSILGKINSIFLVWGGYIISGAGTATLTAAILLKYFNKRVSELEKLIEDSGDNDG